jgi:hypothetical protein
VSVYFVRCTETNLVKIGFAKDPFKRFSKIQSDSPAILELLAIEPGEKSREAEIHEQFASLRRRGEWFECGAAILNHVKALPVVAIQRERQQLGGKLGEWLHKNGLGVREFGEMVGCCWSAVSYFCSGRSIPRHDLMVRIYMATNGEVQPNDFFDLPDLPAASDRAAA